MTSEPLKIAYSPCPNDTFVFDALAALTGAFGKLAPVLGSWNPYDQ